MAYMKDSKGRKLDTFEVEAKAFTPPLKFTSLPGALSGKSQYNGTSYNQDSVSTGDGKRYAVWYDETGALIIGKRTLPNGLWSTFSLSTIAGNPLVLPVDNDPHNSASMIVDAAGYIHVAANMHGDVLRYVRSTNPHDITAWTAPGMTGSNETQVTYPRFALHTDGTLFFLYRDGASGFGDLFLNKWNGAAWTQVGKLADGKTTSENPYESRFVVGRDGSLNLAITWRPNGGDANSNNDVHFIKSADKGVTWTNVSGTAVTIPFTHSNTTALVLDTAATNSGIINQFGLDTDTNNRPHIALMLADGGTPDRNIHHLWWNGTAWVNDQVTDLGNGFSITNWTTRPTIACTNDGRTLITYSTPRFGGVRGMFRLVDVTSGAVTEVPLSDLDMRDVEPTYDGRALRERNELTFMLTAANADVNNPGPEYWNVNNWDRQWGGVLTLDLAQVGSLLRREVRPPRIRTMQTIAVPTNASVTNTSAAAVTGSLGSLTTPDMRNRPVFVRLAARASTTGGTLTVQVFESQQGGSNRALGAIAFTATSTALRATPWMPLAYGPILGSDSLVQIHAYVSATFTGTISAATLEIGVLDGPVY
jgi:hypothetical protein